MADPEDAQQETPHFETDDVEANLAIEQGLGVGARELAAQRDPGGVVTPDEDDGDDADAAIERNTSVLGQDDDDQQLSRNSDA
ncbi:MAG TPA: hypothetical protein VF633_08825 [Brevundimonas sp.]